jgi:hypothetical protein
MLRADRFERMLDVEIKCNTLIYPTGRKALNLHRFKRKEEEIIKTV